MAWYYLPTGNEMEKTAASHPEQLLKENNEKWMNAALWLLGSPWMLFVKVMAGLWWRESKNKQEEDSSALADVYKKDFISAQILEYRVLFPSGLGILLHLS